jgi:hypothetical protein
LEGLEAVPVLASVLVDRHEVGDYGSPGRIG